MQGKVKWFNDKLGYGFIKSSEIENDIFVHFSEIQVKGHKFLRENDIIEFDFNAENNKALNVKIITKGSQLPSLDAK